MLRARAAALALSLAAAVACGGRSERTLPSSDDDAPSQAGAAIGGTVSTAGGRSGSGGTTSTGGVDDQACLARYDTYVEYRATLIEEFDSVPCMRAEECVAFHDQSDCDPQCFRIATAARRGLSDRLNIFKGTACSAECQLEPKLSCPPAAPPQCVSGHCL